MFSLNRGGGKEIARLGLYGLDARLELKLVKISNYKLFN